MKQVNIIETQEDANQFFCMINNITTKATMMIELDADMTENNYDPYADKAVDEIANFAKKDVIINELNNAIESLKFSVKLTALTGNGFGEIMAQNCENEIPKIMRTINKLNNMNFVYDGNQIVTKI